MVRDETVRLALFALRGAVSIPLPIGGHLELRSDNGFPLEAEDAGAVVAAMALELERDPGRTLDTESLEVLAHARAVLKLPPR